MRAFSLFSVAVSGALTAFSLITVSSAWAGVPTAIRSTTDQITQYSPQHRALTLERLCKMMNEGGFEVSKKSAVTCTQHPGDIIEFTGSVVGRENVSVYGNAADKTVIEYFGDNEIHYYQNDQKQVFRFEFIAINTGVRSTSRGAEVLGFYRLDGRMVNDTKTLRVGYFSDLQ